MQDTEVRPLPLEDCEEYLEGKEYNLFVGFFRKMLAWDPTERMTARDLLQHEFLAF